MQAVRHMSAKGITAKCRAFMLWFVATVLIVIAMAISPAYAFAGEQSTLEKGTLTVDSNASASQNTAAPAASAPASTPEPAATSTTVETPAPSAAEPVAAEAPAETQSPAETSASTTPDTATTAEQTQTQAPAAEQTPAVEANQGTSGDEATETPVQGETPATDTDATTPNTGKDASTSDPQQGNSPANPAQNGASTPSTGGTGGTGGNGTNYTYIEDEPTNTGTNNNNPIPAPTTGTLTPVSGATLENGESGSIDDQVQSLPGNNETTVGGNAATIEGTNTSSSASSSDQTPSDPVVDKQQAANVPDANAPPDSTNIPATAASTSPTRGVQAAGDTAGSYTTNDASNEAPQGALNIASTQQDELSASTEDLSEMTAQYSYAGQGSGYYYGARLHFQGPGNSGAPNTWVDTSGNIATAQQSISTVDQIYDQIGDTTYNLIGSSNTVVTIWFHAEQTEIDGDIYWVASEGENLPLFARLGYSFGGVYCYNDYYDPEDPDSTAWIFIPTGESVGKVFDLEDPFDSDQGRDGTVIYDFYCLWVPSVFDVQYFGTDNQKVGSQAQTNGFELTWDSSFTVPFKPNANGKLDEDSEVSSVLVSGWEEHFSFSDEYVFRGWMNVKYVTTLTGNLKTANPEYGWDYLITPEKLVRDQYLIEANSETYTPIASTSIQMYPVFSEDTSVTNFDVYYHNINQAKTAEQTIKTDEENHPDGKYSYTSTNMNVETLANLGISGPYDLDANHTATFVGWATTAANAYAGIADGPGATEDFSNLYTDGTNTYNLYAVWTISDKTFTVKYNGNGGTVIGGSATDVTKPDSGTYTFADANANNSDIKAIANPFERANYEFLGWALGASAADDASAQWEPGQKLGPITDSMLTNGVLNISAVWRKLVYTVTYYSGYGTNENVTPGGGSQEVTYGSAYLDNAPTITRTGYSFNGWRLSSTGGDLIVVPETVNNQTKQKIDPNVLSNNTFGQKGKSYNLYADWSAVSYTVEFWEKWQNNSVTDSKYRHTNSVQYVYDGTAKTADLGDIATALGLRQAGDVDDTNTYVLTGWYITVSGSHFSSATGDVAITDKTVQDAVDVKADINITGSPIVIYAIWTEPTKCNIYYSDNRHALDGTSSTNYDWNEKAPLGSTYTIVNTIPTLSGYTFKYWCTEEKESITGAKIYWPGNDTDPNHLKQITNVSTITLYAQWTPNTVTFQLNNGLASGASFDGELYAKSPAATATVGSTVKASDLVQSGKTPYRKGYTFLGWAESASGKVIIGPDDSGETYSVPTGWASSGDATKILYARWIDATYTVQYNANLGDDTANLVTFKVGDTIISSTVPYVYTTTATRTTSGFAKPAGLSATRPYYKTLVGWSVTANGTTAIADGDQLGKLYDQQRGASFVPTQPSDYVLNLYAIWDAVTFTVYYESADNEHGEVSPAQDTNINLATGKKINAQTGLEEAITGSTASLKAGVVAYELAKPTWTDVNNGRAPGALNAQQATYVPTIANLRSVYDSTGAIEVTYRANFVTKKFNYKVEAYMESATGTWASSPTYTFEIPTGSTEHLSASYGTSVTYESLVSDGTYAGHQVWELALISKSTDAVSNQSLYIFDSTVQGSRTTFPVQAETDTLTNNVLKLYYKRTTYTLVGSFVKKDKAENETTGAPITTDPKTYMNDNQATTNLRWGQEINVTSPSAEGYTFSWSILINGSAAQSTAPGNTLTLGAADMGTLNPAIPYNDNNYNASDLMGLDNRHQGTVNLKGTFKVNSYTITLKDLTNHDGWNQWTAGTTAASLKNTSNHTASTTVAADETLYELNQWVPFPTDSQSYSYYFAGWQDADQNANQDLISSEELQDKHFTSPKTYNAVWKEKLLITYNAGDAGKAAWSTKSIKLNTSVAQAPYPTLQEVESGTATFSSVVGKGLDPSAYLDTSNPNNIKPLGATGWEFDYWTIAGDLDEYRYGHGASYYGDNEEPTHRYLMGTDASSNAYLLDGSVTFIAHWKGIVQVVKLNDTATNGPANNSEVNHNTITATVAGVDSSSHETTAVYHTGDTLNLAIYTVSDIPAGYTFYGWVDANNANNTYTPTSTLTIPAGGITLNPVFHENTVTFRFELADGNSGRGTFNDAEDTVYVVMHNGINEDGHTVTSSNTPEFAFVKWTNSADTATSHATDPEASPVAADTLTQAEILTHIGNGVLTEGRTYYAHFRKIQYTLTFALKGTTDGTDSVGTVVLSAADGSSIDISNNSIKIEYNGTLPEAALLVITPPEGYVLDGWAVNSRNAGTQSLGTGASQGVWSYKVKADTTLYAHFAENSKPVYVVNYEYDPDPKNKSGFSSTELSRNVAWGSGVLPETASNATPSKLGYTFDGWYITWNSEYPASDSTRGFTELDHIDAYKVGGAYKFSTIYAELADRAQESGSNPTGFNPANKSITLYAKWTRNSYYVNYDFWGNTPQYTPNNDTTKDVVEITESGGFTGNRKEVGWNDTAQTFVAIPTTSAVVRKGYILTGWTATVLQNGETIETVSADENGVGVLATDKFAKLAGNNDSNKEVTLHAVWKSEPRQVDYDLNDAQYTGTGTQVVSVNYGWADDVDYLNYPTTNAVPSMSGFKFVGWEVIYKTGTESPYATNKAANITTHDVLKMRDMVGGDTTALKHTPVLTLRAMWVQQGGYFFKDVKVDANGTEHVIHEYPEEKKDAGTIVAFNDAYTYGTTNYDGYVFDNHNTSNAKYTATQIEISQGVTTDYYVYFRERTYTIKYKKNEGDSDTTILEITNSNPWTSSVPTLAATPTKDGYTFLGWFVKDGNVEKQLDDTVEDGGTTRHKKLSEVYATAPTASTLFAYAKWQEKEATIAWTADSNGNIEWKDDETDEERTGDGSATRLATSSKAVKSITAIPAEDYDFLGWYVSYTDESGVAHTDVPVDATFATLSADGKTLTPIKWVSGTGSDKTWGDITYTAKFVLGTALRVTIEFYLQDGDDLTKYTKVGEDPRTDAVNGENYVAPAEYRSLETPKYAGYKFNADKGRWQGVYDVEDKDSKVYKLYYDALKNSVVYKYVKSDGRTDAVAADIPTDAPEASTFGTGDYFTGQTLNVPTVSSVEGWTFKGWYKAGEYNGTNRSGTPMTVPYGGLVLVGSWERVKHTVTFQNDSTSAAAQAGATISSNGNYEVYHGELVGTWTQMSDPTAAAATVLADMNISFNNNGKKYTLTGWDLLIGGVDQNVRYGVNEPLTQYVVNADNVTFRAVWSPTWTVKYDRGSHGAFTYTPPVQGASELPYVEYSGIEDGEAISVESGPYNYAGSTATSGENAGRPTANNGWKWVGWGVYDTTTQTWTYYFNYNANVDYGTTVTEAGYNRGYYTDSNVTSVTRNITFIGFYEPMKRSLVFHDTQYKSGQVSGEAYDPIATFKGNVKTSYLTSDDDNTGGFYTGSYVTMLTADSITREGYVLTDWTDGEHYYSAGSDNDFQMPEVAEGATVHLYPVFSVKQLSIAYDVASDSTGKGTLSNYADAKSTEEHVINGSTPQPAAGYAFAYWTKDDDNNTKINEGNAGNLTPTESGTYHAHFIEKEYSFSMAQYPNDGTVTLPVAAPADGYVVDYTGTFTWLQDVLLAAASRPGYDFIGWDVYDADDWAEHGTGGTRLRHAVTIASNPKVKDLSDDDGIHTSLMLVPYFEKATLGVEYLNTNGDWVTDDPSIYPTEPAGNGATNPAKKINHQIGDEVVLRQAATLHRNGYTLVGWQDNAETPNVYYIDSDYATAHGGVAVTSFIMGSENVILAPIWNKNVGYEVTFIDRLASDLVTTDEVNNMPDDIAVTANLEWDDNVDVQRKTGGVYSVPTRKGYEFAGWTVYESDQSTPIGGPDATPLTDTNYAYGDLALNDSTTTKHIYLYANWTKLSNYNVKFFAGADDSSINGVPADSANENIAYDATVIAPAPTRNGYTFAGWTVTDSNDVSLSDNPLNADTYAYATLVNSNDSIHTVKMTATWTKKTGYTVTFVANGDGVSRMPADMPTTDGTDVVPVEWDTVISLKDDAGYPLREGYVFQGWRIENSASPTPEVLGNTGMTPLKQDSASFADLAYNNDKDANAALTLYAVWQIKTYAVEFDPAVDASLVNDMPSSNANLQFTDSIDAHAPWRAGYSFGGWYNDVLQDITSAGNPVTYKSLVNNNDNELKVKLTAIWNANPHTLAYEAGGGEWSSTASDYPTGDPVKTDAAQPVAAISTKTDAVINLRDGDVLAKPGATLLGWTARWTTGSGNSATNHTEDYRFANSQYTFTMPDADVTLTPIWQYATNFNVLFNTGDSDSGATKVTASTMPANRTDIPYATIDIVAGTPTRVGYTFGGWLNSVTGATIAATTTENPYYTYAALVNNNSDITTVALTAVWTANNIYNVTYNNGVPSGSVSYTGPMPANRTNIGFDAADIAQTALDSTKRAGFSFVGWRVTNDAAAADAEPLAVIRPGSDQPAVYSTLVGGDGTITSITFTAMWEGTPYNVTYHLTNGTWQTDNIQDGGKNSPNAAIQYKAEQYVPLRLADTVYRAGYDLVGWRTAADENEGTSYLFENVTQFKMLAEDVGLWPIWNPKSYTVTFVATDGTGTVAVTDMPYDPTFTNTGEFDRVITHTQPTRNGYQFGGWRITRTGTTTLIKSVEAGSTKYSALVNNNPDIDNITLTAVWTALPKGVKYWLRDGQGTWVSENIHDAGASTPTELVGYVTDATVNVRQADTVKRNGWVLIGWKDSNNSEVPAEHEYLFGVTDSFIMPPENVDLYPIWKERDEYTVTFDGNAPTKNLAPGATFLTNPPADQPAEGQKLYWDSTTGYCNVDTHAPKFTGYTFMGWTVYGSDNVVVGNTAQSPLMGDAYDFYMLANNDDTLAHRHLRLVANWKLTDTYKVIIVANVPEGQTSVTEGTMPREEQAGLTYISTVDYHAPSRLGYTFDGWLLENITNPTAVTMNECLSPGSAEYYTLAGNPEIKTLRLTALWTAKKIYNIHFVAETDGRETPVIWGTLDDDWTTLDGYKELGWDDVIPAGPTPTREGYAFHVEINKTSGAAEESWFVTNTTTLDNVKNIGWATIGTYTFGDLAYDAYNKRQDDTITDITLTALWVPNSHTVTYVLDAGKGTWVKSNITDAGKASPASPIDYAVDDYPVLRASNTVVRAGYVLAGWQDDPENPTVVYYVDAQAASAAGASVTESFRMLDADVILVPLWREKVYTVTFEANKPAEATDTMQNTVGNMPANMDEVAWTGTVYTQKKDSGSAPTLAGYKFTGWKITNRAGQPIGFLNATYTFEELADYVDNYDSLNLQAQWVAATYRVTYLDPIDNDGNNAAVPGTIATDATLYWKGEGSTVSSADPWNVSADPYTYKSNEFWQFNGWCVKLPNGSLVKLEDDDDWTFSALAHREDLTVDKVATDEAEPALKLYASWTQRAFYVVDYKLVGSDEAVADSENVSGLEGDLLTEIAAALMASPKNIPGYTYDSTPTAAGMPTGGILTASSSAPHFVLYYNQLNDYILIIDDDDPEGKSRHERPVTQIELAWNTAGTSFTLPTDWTYTGHYIAGWAYDDKKTGKRVMFDVANGTYGDIAAGIYSDDNTAVTGDEGRDLDGNGKINGNEKPVTLYVVWAEREDYIVEYDDNYYKHDAANGILSGIADDKFIGRISADHFTPGDTEDVKWSSTAITPDNLEQIEKPGYGADDLYRIAGWNYADLSGKQHAIEKADGTVMSFKEIVQAIYGDAEPEDGKIKLYARWEEVPVTLTYTPTLVTVDEHGNVVSIGGAGGGTVTLGSEELNAVTGGTLVDGKRYAKGTQLVKALPGYTFYGWRRASNGDIVTVSGVDLASLSTMSSNGLLTSALLTQALDGLNVLPDGTIDASALFKVMQNGDDGYWHNEEYQALFVQNASATLHYDKNATDATGSIADVEKPYGSLIDLADGSAYKRQYWTLQNWNTKADGTGTTYALGLKEWELPQNGATLYAQWTRNDATITFDGNGGGDTVKGLPESVTGEWGKSYTLSSATPTRDHYEFTGWNTKADGTGTSYAAGSDFELPGAGQTLYAQWKKKRFPVTIKPGHSDGGTTVMTGGDTGGTSEIEYGGHVPEGTITATPDEGYHVSKWHYTMTDEYGNTTEGYVDDPSNLEIIGDVKFTPVFEKDPSFKPYPSPEPTPNSDTASSKGTKGAASAYGYGSGDMPKTGDNLIAYVVIAALTALIALLVLFLAFRRRREDD